MNTVYCPVLQTQVNGADCFKICIVADGEAKPTILSDSIEWNDEQKKKCLNCRYHMDLE